MRRRPPQCVAVVARHHWVTGGAMLFFVALFHGFTREARAFEFSRRGYAITLGIAALYLLTGTTVWLGARPGRYLNYFCSLIYLARPSLGLRLWRINDSAEFKAHFEPGTAPAPDLKS
jgi:hypothetical protein